MLAYRLRLLGPLTARRLVWSLLVAGAAALALFPYGFLATYVFELVYLGLPLALLAGLAGYLPRRRWSDAAWLALPVLAANSIEQQVGSPALVCLALPWFALTRRPRFAIALGGSLLGALLIGGQLKMRFAGSRLAWPDIQYFFAQFRDNIGVIESQPTVALYAGAAIVLVCVLVAGGWYWDRRGGDAGDAGNSISSPGGFWRLRRLGASLAASLLAASLVAWSATELAAEARRSTALGVWRLAQSDGWSAEPISRFLATAALKPRWTPVPVDTAAFQRDSHALVGSVAPGATLPDVLLFLQESQMNPAAIDGCPARACRLPVFDAAAQTVAAGPLRVHVYGAGTWLSEFAVATGVPHTAFGEAGSFAPFSVAPGTRGSFVRSMRAAGYRTVAVYPTRGGMMNGRKAYAGYGFDHFYDAIELGLDGAFTTSDEDMHRAALRVLDNERRAGKPVLLFVITIFNHGEHGVKMDRVPSALRREMQTRFADAREADSLADYVWRTQEFQRVMAATRRAVLGGPRPAVVAWYGDHQPAFGSAMALRTRVQPLVAGAPARFVTWYDVSSNLPHAKAPPASALDIAFLPGVLAQAAGVPLDDWLAANVSAREACGGMFDECRAPSVRDAYLSYLWKDLKVFDLP